MADPSVEEVLRGAAGSSAPLDPHSAWTAGRRLRRRRQRSRGLLVIAVLLVAVAGLLVTRRASDTAVTTGGERPAVWSGTGRWEKVADGPDPARVAGMLVAAGEKLFLYGGLTDVPAPDPASSTTTSPKGYTGSERVDGAVFDARTRRWSPIPDAPVPFLGFNGEVTRVWTGTELLVWSIDYGGRKRSIGARYDPARNTWRRMADQDVVGYGIGTWTGSELLVFGPRRIKSPSTGPEPSVVLAYSPATDSWRRLTDGPPNVFLGPFREAMWVGPELLLRSGSDSFTFFNPATDTWRTVRATRPGVVTTTTGVRSQADDSIVGPPSVDGWTGDVVAESLGPVGSAVGDGPWMRYDPSADRWQDMAAPPRPVAGAFWQGSPVDHHAVFTSRDGGPLLAYDGRADRWDELPLEPGSIGPEPPHVQGLGPQPGTLVWTGRELLSFVPAYPGGRAGGVYRFVPG
jgi:hypothetical protein